MVNINFSIFHEISFGQFICLKTIDLYDLNNLDKFTNYKI